MPNFFVVRLLDVQYAPFVVGEREEAPQVRVSFNGSTQALPLTPAGAPGLYELEVPSGTQRAVVTIRTKGFWDINQELLLSDASPPSPFWGSPIQVQSKSLEVHERGDGYEVVYQAIPMQCRNARDGHSDKLSSLTLKEHQVRDFDMGHLLSASGTAWNRFNQSTVSAMPDGELFFIERPVLPKLVALYVPKSVLDLLRNPSEALVPGRVPLHFHVVFHPHPDGFGNDYPYGEKYVGLVNRYVLGPPEPGKGMAFASQHHAAQKLWILAFPVAMPVKGFGGLLTKSSLYRCLQELTHWLQRTLGYGVAVQRLGRVALSGFSYGGAYLMQVLGSSENADFETNHLREVYALDCIFDDPSHAASAMANWLAKDPTQRRLRVYSQNANEPLSKTNTLVPTLEKRLSALPDPPVRMDGPSGSFEYQGSSATLLYTPKSFWDTLYEEAGTPDPWGAGWNYWVAHQQIPSVFLEHALKTSLL